MDPGNGKWGRRPDRVEDGSSGIGRKGSLPMLRRAAVEREVLYIHGGRTEVDMKREE